MKTRDHRDEKSIFWGGGGGQGQKIIFRVPVEPPEGGAIFAWSFILQISDSANMFKGLSIHRQNPICVWLVLNFNFSGEVILRLLPRGCLHYSCVWICSPVFFDSTWQETATHSDAHMRPSRGVIYKASFQIMKLWQAFKADDFGASWLFIYAVLSFPFFLLCSITLSLSLYLSCSLSLSLSPLFPIPDSLDWIEIG